MKSLALIAVLVLGAFPRVLKAESGPLWVSLISRHLECGDAESDYSDIAEGRNKLENLGIRVLTTERNIHPDHQKANRQCSESGGYVSCYLIFPSDLARAGSAGFLAGGNCGDEYKKRVH